VDERSEGGGRDESSTAGWHADPTGRYEFRWFNGTQWTADVSVEGQRYVDPMIVSAPPSHHHVVASRPPSRTPAVLSLVFGLISITIAWIPFLFVVGVLGAIAAIVLGIVAIRRARAGGSGRGLAIGGIATAAGAICLCPVGVILSITVYDEVIDYTEPGPRVTEVTSCTADGSLVDVAGTIENRDDEERSYVVGVDIGDAGGRRATAHVEVDDVAAGEVRKWTHREFVSGLDSATVRCEVDEVTGPYPFGVDLDG
jgi:hypothetical protein